MSEAVAADGADLPVIVAGAGAVGLALALALARAAVPVTLVGHPGPARPGRTVALLQGAVALLRRLEVWPDLEGAAAPLAAMRLVDATGSVFRPPPVVFHAAEVGLPSFGSNVPNDALDAALWRAAGRTAGLRVVADTVADVHVGAAAAEVATRGAGTLRGALVVGADGRGSQVRKAARIGVRETRHPQEALTAVLAHEAAHRDVSTEFHTRQGPFTLVPLPDGPGATPRSSLVWVMDPAEAGRRAGLPPAALAAEMERQCGRLLGRFAIEGVVGRFPIVTSLATRLVADRTVLVGEAAHALPPIGAQGLNLSFRDVAGLAAHLARANRGALGEAATLRAYARSRAGDIAARAGGVGLLNGSLLSDTAAADLLRGAGLAALSRSRTLRRFAMRHGLTSDAGVPARAAT